jgi:hypothetical protein
VVRATINVHVCYVRDSDVRHNESSAFGNILVKSTNLEQTPLLSVHDPYAFLDGRMSEPPADPALLFTTPPRKRSTPARDPPVSTYLLTQSRRPRRSFFVAPPVLLSAEKRQYKELPASFKEGVDFDETVLDSVVGEYDLHGTKYYFARFKDGITHRVSGFTV